MFVRTFTLSLALSLSWSFTASAQLAVPTSHPGNLPGQPTHSLLISATDLPAWRAYWTTPANAVQAGWIQSVNSYANQTPTLAAPSTFSAAVAQSQIAQAKALRWLMDPVTYAADKATVVTILSSYAKVTGGTTITRPEVVQSYYQAFDFINSGLTAAERTAITARLSGSNVKGTITGLFNEPTQVNNQRLKHASTRAFGALLFNDNADIDSQLSRINSSLASNTTNDGAYTDSTHYLNYATAQLAPFVKAYRNHTGISLGSNLEPLARMALAMRSPNGLIGTSHNNLATGAAIHQYAAILPDATIAGAAIWNVLALAGFDWTSWSNAVNNDWSYVDFFALTDFRIAPRAPDWSPAFFAAGQSRNVALRSDWSTEADFLSVNGGIDGANGAGFAHADTASIAVAARGTDVLVGPGYNRTGLSNTPAGFNAALATSHNIVLAKDTGTSTWGAGNAASQTAAASTTTLGNRLDSTEFGNFEGVGDGVSVNWNYGAGSAAGNDTSGRRHVAFPHQSYFVMADTFGRTDATNKDFAVNLVGKGTQTVLVNTPAQVQVRWDVTALGPFRNGATLGGFPFNQPQDGAVIAHVVGSHALGLTTGTTWMHEQYDRYDETNFARVALSNVSSGATISILETLSAGAPSNLTVTNLSTTSFAAASVVDTNLGVTDFVLAQASAVVRSVADFNTDARYFAARTLQGAGGITASVALTQGTSVARGGARIVTVTQPTTLSLSFVNERPNLIRGTVAADGLVLGAELRLYGACDIIEATLGGVGAVFGDAGSYRYVVLGAPGELVITCAP